MSNSPERISSYRRHFEDSSSSSYQVRVSSPSPTRRQARHASTGYSARAGSSSMCVESVGRRAVSASRRSRMAGIGAGALVCVGPGGEPPIDLDAASAENQEFLNTRKGERQEMIVLNDRLAVYIEKVRSLEQKNKLLETEIETYQNRFEKPTGLRLLYEEQLKELKKIADQMKVQRDISLSAKESTAAQLEAIKIKYEEAMELRKKAELDIEVFRPDVDKATSSRIALEKRLEQLEVEIEFLKRIHQQEIDELMKQIYSAHVSAESAFALPDLAGALKQIQTQYDDIAAKNLQEMDSWYKNKFEDLTKKSSRHVDKVRSIREEMAGAKKDIQSKERDLDATRTRNEALEAQIRERDEKYRKELEDLQARIETLQLELKSTKEKIALHLREYQDLLNIKMALEIEITTYRKLIEGEDLRLSGMMKSLSLTSCSMSVIGAGVSLGGGSVDAVGGVGGGLMGASRGAAGSAGSDLGIGGIGGGIGSSPGIGSLDGRIGTGGTINGTVPAGILDVTRTSGSRELGVGGVGVRAGTEGMGIHTGGGGLSSVGTAGLVSSHDREIGAGGIGSGAGIFITGPDGPGSGVGRSEALDTKISISGPSAGGLDSRVGGSSISAGGLDSRAGGSSVGSGELNSTVRDSGIGAGGLADEISLRTGSDTPSSAGGMGVAGTGFDHGHGGVEMGEVRVSGQTNRHGSKVRGLCSTETGSGIGGNVGTAEKVVDDARVAPSGHSGMNQIRGGMSDTSGAKTGYGSDGFDGSTEAYAEQAVELTERRTVLIR
uniref:Zgc:172323 n=1 Tax=Nothobranchius furzeri TaxID=105023 RepID=A0A8C6MHS8_NOTFU